MGICSVSLWPLGFLWRQVGLVPGSGLWPCDLRPRIRGFSRRWVRFWCRVVPAGVWRAVQSVVPLWTTVHRTHQRSQHVYPQYDDSQRAQYSELQFQVCSQHSRCNCHFSQLVHRQPDDQAWSVSRDRGVSPQRKGNEQHRGIAISAECLRSFQSERQCFQAAGLRSEPLGHGAYGAGQRRFGHESPHHGYERSASGASRE